MAGTDPFRLDDKVVLVTGASTGLGRHCAQSLHAAGAAVIATARQSPRLDELAQSLPDVVTVAGDLADAAARERLVSVALAVHGRIDILVNNAGWAQSAPALEEGLDRFGHALEVDLVAPFDLAVRVAASMTGRGAGSRGGSIVNVASVSALRAYDRYPLAGYAAAKSGVVGLTRELAAQWGRDGIRVNAVAPGWFPTRMTGFLADPDQQDWVRRHTALGRPGENAELAAAVRFLASDAASYITGQVLAVDGGWTAY